MRWYLDSSAALKLIVEEAESDALAAALAASAADLVSGVLLETEVRRAVTRQGSPGQSVVTKLLEGIDLREMPASIFRAAGTLPGRNLRSLDALHLATAVRFGVDAVVTYDVRMREGAEELGLNVHSFGAW